MKLERLLEITNILLNKKNIKAVTLAEKFEVSVRTIYRDVETLAASGVPVYATQGKNGGIMLQEGFTINRSLLTQKDSDALMMALKSLKVTKYPEVDSLLNRIGIILNSSADDWIQIDMTPWGSDPNKDDKITVIKNAILECCVFEFDYISAENIRTSRRIEPLQLIYKDKAWYVWGWCLDRNDFRMFRLSRIKKFFKSNKIFLKSRKRVPVKTEAPEEKNKPQPEPVEIVLTFNENALYKLYDDYDDALIHNNDDGTYTVKFYAFEEDWMIHYILGFGGNVKVVSPDSLKQKIKEHLSNALSNYLELS